jgi:thymidylate synthase ThyX/5-methylcytosine-specific restriction endonuclease McrA
MADGIEIMSDLRVIADPTVYLLSKQTLQQGELDRFLADHGVTWSSDSTVASEVVTETAGRVCYMSYAKPRPGGNAAYLGHIKEVGHGSVFEHAVWTFLLTGLSRSLTHELVRHRAGWAYCLAGDTLIYSDHYTNGKREGTKKRRIDDLFAKTQTPHGRSRLKLLRLRCLDETTGTFTNGRVKQVAFSGAKPVFRVELEGGKGITCSRDHRFLTPYGWQPLHQIVGGLDVSAGGLAVHGPLSTPIATNGVAAYKSADWLRRHYVELGLAQQQIATLAGVSTHTIRSWVRKHGLQKPLGSWTINREPWNKGRQYTAGWKHTPETRRRLGEQKRGGKNPQWKGGITPFSVSVRRGVADLAPEVLTRFDFTCRLCRERGGKLVMHHVLPIWARPDLALAASNLVPLCEPCHQQRVNGHELEFAEQFGAEKGEIETAGRRSRNTGGGQTLIPRYRKIVSVTYAGVQDTYDIEMDGPNANFVANGIVTHNSQLSQRYVDESVAEYVEPDIIANDPELHAVWHEAVTHAHAAYVKLAELLNTKLADPAAAAAAMLPPDADRTTRRKTALQAARSVLPNATETKITVTANARALRHFLEQRGSVHAEPEIRKLANALLEVLAKDAPNLFGDYKRTPLPDGTFEITTEFPKV